MSAPLRSTLRIKRCGTSRWNELQDTCPLRPPVHRLFGVPDVQLSPVYLIIVMAVGGLLWLPRLNRQKRKGTKPTQRLLRFITSVVTFVLLFQSSSYWPPRLQSEAVAQVAVKARLLKSCRIRIVFRHST